MACLVLLFSTCLWISCGSIGTEEHVVSSPDILGTGASVTSITPNSVTAGGGGFTLRVSGSGFSPTSQLRWNGVRVATTVVASNQLTAAITSAHIAQPGIVSIFVVDTKTGLQSNPLTFTVNPAGNPPDPPPPTLGNGIVGIWMNDSELAARPISGAAWNSLKAQADSSCGVPELANQDDKADACVLAKALVFGRTKEEAYRVEVVAALTSIVNSGAYNGRALALGRNLAPYVIAADLIGLKVHDPVLDAAFRNKLRELLTTFTDGGPSSLVECHEVRPNNWGTYCGASRIAVAVYLSDRTQIERAAQVFKGYLGDRASYAGFVFGSDSASWSPTPSTRVPINPRGATVSWDGADYSVDGAVIDDMRRGCTFQWPPCHTGYAWEALAGALVQAEILHRAGYTPYEWQSQALRRAYEYLHFLHMETGGVWFDDGTVSGDDNWQPWVVNRRYGTDLPTHSPTTVGKGMAWTDWTHGP